MKPNKQVRAPIPIDLAAMILSFRTIETLDLSEVGNVIRLEFKKIHDNILASYDKNSRTILELTYYEKQVCNKFEKEVYEPFVLTSEHAEIIKQ